MFDPTIFDNLKVGIENHVYDLDTIEQLVQVTNRKDQIELSVMSRFFSIEFQLLNETKTKAQIILQSTVKDLADEILNVQGTSPGTMILVRFSREIKEMKTCEEIEEILTTIWNPEQPLKQNLCFQYGDPNHTYINTIDILFNDKINEEHMSDIPTLVEHILKSLRELNVLI
ncbi:hypothetical protein JCM9140_2629 [Halalkalibacter wakoensis JCM 9140]|uniref:Uncharacterized protein n=1 Tax=Halalkalibacter wakoensis JCM 9140 TaxID=1236970 RepID=W4Q5C4_9BACI|nr:hypothetical protein [Halalkalibacter wakoensis]GAE26549.1 hypothetical protein JCM9140_2629 [Halalkalibacter wakoensis JCM 9140]